MKKFFAVGLALLSILMFSGCKSALREDDSRIPQIMMITVHNNWAWGIEQSVTVIDRDGNRHSQYCNNEKYDYKVDHMPDEWIDLKEDGWYEKLLEIAENGKAGVKLSETEAGYIRKNARNFAGWSSLSVKEYVDAHTFDYGVKVLYGIYLDEDSNPCLARLACAGDSMECADSADARKFVNGTGLLRMDGFEYT